MPCNMRAPKIAKHINGPRSLRKLRPDVRSFILCIDVQETGWQSGAQSCLMSGLPKHLVQGINVGTVFDSTRRITDIALHIALAVMNFAYVPILCHSGNCFPCATAIANNCAQFNKKIRIY